MIKKKDFDEWLENPVTIEFMTAIDAVRDKAVNDWNQVSWNDDRLWRDGQAGYMRTACRARAECAEDIRNMHLAEEEDEESIRDLPD